MGSSSSNSDGYLVLCAYAIALLDLVSAVLFAVVSGMLYAKNSHWTSLVALIFTIFWILIIIVLVLGIYKRQLTLIRCWLAFTCLGIFLDGIILIYGLTLAIAVNWEGVKVTVLPFVGLAVEMTFVYIIHLLYLEMTGTRNSQPEEPRAKGGADVQPVMYNDRQLREKEAQYEYRRHKRLAKERRLRDKAILKDMEKRLRHGLG
ncbi:uncharacterized protein LOC111071505 [Drosophila obscura]|uniref:uncharacterized protein LOC111071505 n=1 Tax=Drosophila obscura TaxID=7282 RepID=UPI000BA136DC|nr:uncharacterized protein LOC111071505 [Drosophila obscura]